MIKTIGHFLESVNENQVVYYYDRNSIKFKISS